MVERRWHYMLTDEERAVVDQSRVDAEAATRGAVGQWLKERGGLQNVFQRYEAYIDGGSRGNPGRSGYGVVVRAQPQGETVWLGAGAIESATCNEAEYAALIALLDHAAVEGWQKLHVHSDSKLLVNTASGKWRVKAGNLKPMLLRVQELMRGRAVTFEWVPRERNAQADGLANKAMDEAEA